MVKFTVNVGEKYSILSFEIEGGVLDPAKLRSINDIPPECPRHKGLVISGRGPQWLYAHLVHLAHPFAWVATADPRLGAVVVQRHVVHAPALGDTFQP